MEKIQFEVRTMRREDFPQILDIQKETGWQICIESCYSWYEFDPNGFKVAVADSGEILGLCCAVRHSEDFYFVGFYVVRKKYRGMGIGWKVFVSCLEYIGHRDAGLNSVQEMTAKYQKIGFSFLQSDSLVQTYETYDEIHPENLSNKVPDGVTILPFHESHLPRMFKFDRQMSGFDRQLIVELNCKEKESKTVVALKGDICVGYASIKSNILGIPYVGPMYADDADIAEAMLKDLLLTFSLRKGLYMITFAAHQAANDMMKKIGCPKSDSYPRLYKRSDLNMDFRRSMHKIFAHFHDYFSPF